MYKRAKTDARLQILACALILIGLALLAESATAAELERMSRRHRDKRAEAEELLDKRDRQLDGALVEIKKLSDRVDHLTTADDSE